MTVLDMVAAITARDEALAMVEEKHAEWIETARHVARCLAKHHGTVTADMVHEVLDPAGIKPHHHNAWGGVFNHPDFLFTGEYRHSEIPSHHRNLQRVWRVRRSAT